MTRKCSVKVVSVLLAFLPIAAVQAADLKIDLQKPGKITLVHDPWWEDGVVSNGYDFPGYQSGETTAGPGASFYGRWIASEIGTPSPGTGIVYIVNAYEQNTVEHMVIASWNDNAAISLQVVSSNCRTNLGVLPPQFAGSGVPDTGGAIPINGIFRDLFTANPVVIPSNLTITTFTKNWKFGKWIGCKNRQLMKD